MARVLAAALVALVLIGGCSSNDTSTSGATSSARESTPSSSSPATGASAELCSSVQALQQSVQRLSDVQVTADGLPALESAWETVKADGQRVIDAGQDRYATQVARLRADMTGIDAAVAAATAAPNAATLAAVRAAVSTLAGDVRSVGAQLSEGC